jgi:RNA polymerase sigma-70 factor (ECF subfamily)
MTTQSKDRQFERLIDQELPKFRGIAFRILRNAPAADDAVQEALFKAYQRFDSFQNAAALSSWVCRIVVNCSYDILRKRKREQDALGGYTPPAPRPDTSALEEAIAELPEPYRDAIVIGVLSGFSGKEAAKILGISPNVLYQRIYKAKQMLKNTLTKEDN